MRRWDGLAERYLEEYAGRGWCPERVQAVRRELGQWGLPPPAATARSGGC